MLLARSFLGRLPHAGDWPFFRRRRCIQWRLLDNLGFGNSNRNRYEFELGLRDTFVGVGRDVRVYTSAGVVEFDCVEPKALQEFRRPVTRAYPRSPSGPDRATPPMSSSIRASPTKSWRGLAFHQHCQSSTLGEPQS